jgi:BirA family biotin operon repressor/biotin-[acetyl-CoA-carboxylase] ligase
MKISATKVDDAILAALQQQNYVSGQELSRKLGLSRAAVWKHIQTLRRTGYEIKARAHQGYLLTGTPDILSPWELGRHLKTQRVGSVIRTFGEVDSTNEVAYRLGLQGAGEGTAVIADSQTKGRGRLRRSWISPPGRNLYLSVLLRPRAHPSVVPLLTYMGVVAAVEALGKNLALEPEIKWPNDLLVKGRKLAGFLNEAKSEMDQIDFVVLGFGINLNMEREDFPAEIRELATSVKLEIGRRVSRVAFTCCLLESIDVWYDIFLTRGASPILERWESIAHIRGKFLEVRSCDRVHQGEAQGLDRDGALILRKETGDFIRVVAGDVTVIKR